MKIIREGDMRFVVDAGQRVQGFNVKLIREGDMRFVVDAGQRVQGFNVKLIASVAFDDYGCTDGHYYTVTGPGFCFNLNIDVATATQLFQDTPWIHAVPRKS